DRGDSVGPAHPCKQVAWGEGSIFAPPDRLASAGQASGDLGGATSSSDCVEGGEGGPGGGTPVPLRPGRVFKESDHVAAGNPNAALPTQRNRLIRCVQELDGRVPSLPIARIAHCLTQDYDAFQC